MLTIGSPADFCVFFVSLVLAGSAFVTAPCAKSDVIDESKAAIVCVIFPGFMRQEQHNALHMLDATPD